MFKVGDKVKRIKGTFLGMCIGDTDIVNQVDGNALWLTKWSAGSHESGNFILVKEKEAIMPTKAKAVKPVPHVHAKLIKLWAANPMLKFQCRSALVQAPWQECPKPTWSETLEYRIKVEPKPDVVRYAKASFHIKGAGFDNEQLTKTFWTNVRTGSDNIKATFDGETGKLKAVEIIS